VFWGFAITEFLTITLISFCWKVNVAKSMMNRYFVSCFSPMLSAEADEVSLEVPEPDPATHSTSTVTTATFL
jgi:hypothetical protein